MIMFVLYSVVNQQGSLRLGDWLGPPVPPDTAWLPQGQNKAINIQLTCYLLALQLSSYHLEKSGTDSILLPETP